MQTKEQCLTTKLALSRALIKNVFAVGFFFCTYYVFRWRILFCLCFIMGKKGLPFTKSQMNTMKQQNDENAMNRMCNADLIAHINVSFR